MQGIMMEKTLEQRCKVALECLPDARYRTMLGGLFDELLARAAVPVVQPPEFQEVSWGVDSTMRPCTGMAVSEYAFREWAKANGIALVAPLARQEPADGLSAVDATEQRRTLLAGEWDWSEVAGEPAASAECAATQRHITDMLVAHRDMIEAQQRGDGEAEVLAVRRMEAARSAIDSAASGVPVDAAPCAETYAGCAPDCHAGNRCTTEQTEPFWCHEQSHDRPRCETQCAECAEDGTPLYTAAGVSVDDQPMPSIDEMMAVVRLYGEHPTPHNEFKVRCALRDQALGGPHMENPAEVDPSGYKVKLPYTEAIRKADTDGEFTYSTDQDFSDPEKCGWERVYGVDHMIEYGNACARAALVALGRNADVRMSVLRGKACTCGVKTVDGGQHG